MPANVSICQIIVGGKMGWQSIYVIYNAYESYYAFCGKGVIWQIDVDINANVVLCVIQSFSILSTLFKSFLAVFQSYSVYIICTKFDDFSLTEIDSIGLKSTENVQSHLFSFFSIVFNVSVVTCPRSSTLS